jgi:hypothetical protein
MFRTAVIGDVVTNQKPPRSLGWDMPRSKVADESEQVENIDPCGRKFRQRLSEVESGREQTVVEVMS